LFVTCVRHRCHFHILLQLHYLSDDRVLKHMCAINISVATSQFSHCYFYSGMRKNVGPYFLSNLPTISESSKNLIESFKLHVRSHTEFTFTVTSWNLKALTFWFLAHSCTHVRNNNLEFQLHVSQLRLPWILNTIEFRNLKNGFVKKKITFRLQLTAFDFENHHFDTWNVWYIVKQHEERKLWGLLSMVYGTLTQYYYLHLLRPLILNKHDVWEVQWMTTVRSNGVHHIRCFFASRRKGSRAKFRNVGLR
jgi:hypothetical protein